MPENTEDRLLFREATDLAIRLQNDPTNAVSIELVRTWIARGPSQASAWARVVEIHGMSGKVLERNRRLTDGAGISRRGMLMGGCAALGSITLLTPTLISKLKADHATSTAQIEKFPLPDGSSVTLGPDSAIAVNFSQTRRQIDLLKGMAHFDAAADIRRPFMVNTGEISFTSAAAVFDLSNDAGFVSISVEQAIGGVRALAPSIDADELVQQSHWLTVNTEFRDVQRGQNDHMQAGSWRDGVITTDRETVSALVAKISRWMPAPVLIVDRSLGQRRVSGIFNLGQPLGALEAVVRPFGGRVRTIGPLMTVIS